MAAKIKEFDTKSLFAIDDAKLAVIERLAKGLLDGRTRAEEASDAISIDDMTTALKRLFAEGLLPLPTGAKEQELLQIAGSAIKLALSLSGQPGLASLATTVALPLTGNAIRWIRTAFNRCGGLETERSAPASQNTPIAQRTDGRHGIIFFVEEEGGLPLLPAVDGSPRIALSCLSLALDRWAIRLKLDIQRSGNVGDANLIVSSRRFTRTEVPDEVLALTDIGPPGGLQSGKHLQLRMVFDLNDTFTETEFTATAAHEFGHFLGIRHRDVQPHTAQLMNDTLSDIVRPQAEDLNAAVRKGWIRS